MQQLYMQLSEMVQREKSKDLWYNCKFNSKFFSNKMGFELWGNRSNDGK
jgi:hypothetical protein